MSSHLKASNSTPTFGDLRALLHHTPSSARWHDLVLMLDATPDPWPDEVVHYVRTHLLSWPSKLKRAPINWLRLFLDTGRAPQLLSACTCLQLGTHAQLLGDEHMLALARTPELFDALHVLEAPAHGAPMPLMLELLLSPWCAELRALEFKGNPLGIKGLKPLMVLAAHVPKLERLGLSHTSLRAQSRHDPLELIRFLQSPLVQRLTHLDLSYNELGWGAGETLVTGLGTGNHLESLGLASCDLISEDIPHIASLAHAQHALARLNLAHNHLAEELLDEFITRAQGVSLESLALNGNAADLGTVNTLARCIDLEKLTLGEATDVRPEDEVMHTPYEGLRHLDIHGGIQHVWRALFEDVDALPDLDILEISNTPTRLDVFDELMQFVQDSELRRLHLGRMIATEEMCELLRAIEPVHIEACEFSDLRGDLESQEKLIGIDWIADTLIS